MGLTDCERQYMVKLRMDKSIRFLEEAKQMVGLKLWDLAANRFYYSCFHAAQALLLEYGFSAHTHEGTLSLFGLHFVKTKIVDVSLGSFFSSMEQLRKKADYNCNYDVSEEEVATMIEPANCFVSTISELLYSDKKNNSDSLS